MGNCAGKPNNITKQQQNSKNIQNNQNKNSQSTDQANNNTDVNNKKGIKLQVYTKQNPKKYYEQIKNKMEEDQDNEPQCTRRRVKTMFNKDVMKQEQKKLDNNEDGYFTEEQRIYFQALLEEEKEQMEQEYKEKKKKGKSSQIKWQKGECIGKGAFGQVFKAKNQETSEIMAVKQIIKSNLPNSNEKEKQDMLDALQSEIEILKHLKHQNIVKYIGANYDKQINVLNIFLEFISEGSISDIQDKYKQQKNGRKLNEQISRNYMENILEGLEYLHSHKVIHRDIKCANILVDKGKCKLTDFGSSKRMVNQDIDEKEQKNKFEELKGTVNWMAPEALRQEEIGRFSDIWSIGCTLLEMVTGELPFPQFDNILTAILQIGSGKIKPEIPEELSENCKNFLKRCFEIEPQKRANVCELIKHPFIQDNRKLNTNNMMGHSDQQNTDNQLLYTPGRGNILRIKSKKNSYIKNHEFVGCRTPQQNNKKCVTPSPYISRGQKDNTNKYIKQGQRSSTGGLDDIADKKYGKNILQRKFQSRANDQINEDLKKLQELQQKNNPSMINLNEINNSQSNKENSQEDANMPKLDLNTGDVKDNQYTNLLSIKLQNQNQNQNQDLFNFENLNSEKSEDKENQGKVDSVIERDKKREGTGLIFQTLGSKKLINSQNNIQNNQNYNNNVKKDTIFKQQQQQQYQNNNNSEIDSNQLKLENGSQVITKNTINSNNQLFLDDFNLNKKSQEENNISQSSQNQKQQLQQQKQNNNKDQNKQIIENIKVNSQKLKLCVYDKDETDQIKQQETLNEMEIKLDLNEPNSNEKQDQAKNNSLNIQNSQNEENKLIINQNNNNKNNNEIINQNHINNEQNNNNINNKENNKNNEENGDQNNKNETNGSQINIKNDSNNSSSGEFSMGEVEEESEDDGNLTDDFDQYETQRYFQQQQQQMAYQVLSMERAVQETLKKNKQD